MLSTTLENIEPSQFLNMAAYLARSPECDVLLSSPGFPSSGQWRIGLMIKDEMVITGNHSRDDIRSFVTMYDRPTFGYLSYEYGFPANDLTPRKKSQFAKGHLKKYYDYIYYNPANKQVIIDTEIGPLDRIKVLLEPDGPASEEVERLPRPIMEFKQSLSRSDYLNKVKKTIDYIKKGYIYQINLTIKFCGIYKEFSPDQVFFDLFNENPAPYYALFRSGYNTIISTSPERFLKVADGQVVSQPIKGTLALENDSDSVPSGLTESPKESSELSMIVDMIRNDISANCQPGTVAVTDHKATFKVDNLLQMYSTVSGVLDEHSDCIDLLIDAFPGGSITGCPKKKAMELIDQLEPHPRDIYCGSVFVIDNTRQMESSVAIRSGYHDKSSNAFNFYAGSGIVVDSDPEKEYEETLAKAAKFFNYFGQKKTALIK